MMPLRTAALIGLLGAAACTTGPSVPSPFDGTYAGEFVLELALSPQTCPMSDTGQAVMRVRGGQARIDVAQAAYFSGHVDPAGVLSLTSGQGRTAFINGRITGATFAGQGIGVCQYRVRMVKQPARGLIRPAS